MIDPGWGALDHLDKPLQAPLMAWARRLHAWLGPLARVDRGDGGTPEGYGDIRRRAALHRLLPSEHLLASAAPDLFLTRLADGDPLGFELDRRASAPDPVCRVVFDAGPHQLGVTRVAQLVLLSVFARRARLGGARLSWSVLPDGGPGVGGDDLSAWRGLLGARSWEAPSPEELLPASGTAREPWTVGSLVAPGWQALALARAPDGRSAIARAPGRPALSLPAIHVDVLRRVLRGAWTVGWGQP